MIYKNTGTHSVLQINKDVPDFLELNETHTLRTEGDTLEIIGSHTSFSDDVTVSGELAIKDMVVGQMRMERKNDTGNIGVDFIFI